MRKAHHYMPNSVESIQQKMMEEIGISDLEELFKVIPEGVRLKRKLQVPSFGSEFELRLYCEQILAKNRTVDEMPTFLGGGIWPHYIPSVVSEVVRRAEFATSYTPYQPELSQGMLQALFEYQSLVCELTGMEYANCSMYDWASALGEAARMAVRATGRHRLIYPRFINPERSLTLRAYVEPLGVELIEVRQNLQTGQVDLEDLQAKATDETAGIYIENPSYLGYLEAECEAIGEVAHKVGAIYMAGVDPLSLGIVREPGDYGADVVIGEGQPLGIPMSYGGPLLGILACRGEATLRQMPGRVVGVTTTKDGRERAFCNALQTREQHIRREKATSNICTNEALMAVAGAAYLSLLGPQGLRELGRTIMAKSHYAMRLIGGLDGVKAPLLSSCHFKEFVINFDATGKGSKDIHHELLKKGIHGGKVVSDEFPELGEAALYCITEVHTVKQIEGLVEALRQVLEG